MPLEPSLVPVPPSVNPWQIVAFAALGVVGAVVILVARPPPADNTIPLTMIFGFLVTTLTLLVGQQKASMERAAASQRQSAETHEVHKLVNSQMEEMKRLLTAEALARGELKGKKDSREEAAEDAASDAQEPDASHTNPVPVKVIADAASPVPVQTVKPLK